MRGLQNSKRVSWASDLNLCQVKLFLSDECPSQVGLGGEDDLQAKASWPCYSGGSGASDDNLPPGFEGIQPANLFQNKLSQIPVIQWKCPSRFVLDPNWQVAAAEESKEVDLESQREMRVLEAVYPRPSAIPPNPASPMGAEESYYNDLHTPLIPITPIEDEDIPPDTSSSSSIQPNTPIPSQPTNGTLSPGVEPDVITAAYSALTTAMSNTSQGNLIDQNLLIKILSNPTLIEKLVSAHGPSTSTQQPVSIPIPTPTPTLPPVSIPMPIPDPPPPVHSRTTHLPYSTPSSSSGPHYPPQTRVGPVHVPVPVSNVPLQEKKDINYYKSLIQQHGGEKVDNNNMKNRDTKQKIMKPCIYFNSTRGCRHGANCVFQHDSSSQQRVSSLAEPQNAKRMKMDSKEITGT